MLDGVCDVDGTALITREDDREAVLWERLKVYEKLTGPVIDHYAKSQYFRIDGTMLPGEVSAAIETVLNSCLYLEPRLDSGCSTLKYRNIPFSP
jgi:adenylate kinase